MSIKNWIFKLPRFRGAAGATATDSLLKEMAKILEESSRQALEDAHAAAAAGTGPQTWDADWCENAIDISEEVEAMVSNWSWQHVQTFQEILSWALASPQGQKAQEMQGETTSPWNDGLEMLEEMRSALTYRGQTLLQEQSKGLHYSEEQREELSEALDELLSPQKEEA
jgi:hypothetical protein